ncbi:MAG: hypothetical protein HRU26_07500 [Psychroserpens sp.]|nr:hypothetical protein [Psychroserpens sp.]
MSISTAVGTELKSKVVGYELLAGNFSPSTPNLPQSIAVFGQANTDKQSGLTNDPVVVTSESQAGDLFGYGSQIHIAMRILRSKVADRVGGIPTVVYPQLAPSGGTARVETITVSSVATADAVHTVYINGRSIFDGDSLEIPIANGNTPSQIASKISDAINNATSCAVTAAAVGGVVTITTKWVGESTNELYVEVVPVDGQDVGVSYAVAQDSAGSGDSSAEISESLALFGDTWHTIVVNPYPKSRYALFESFNGVAGVKPATGRYASIIWKPFICYSGNTDESISNIISGLDNDQATIRLCTAPNSKGWDVEAAANAAAIEARIFQDTPHQDGSGNQYFDMPAPLSGLIGEMSDYTNRNLALEGGASTVKFVNGKYEMMDCVTTYNPAAESEPQYRYVRTLMIDFNIEYSYFLNEQLYVVDHVILKDTAATSVGKTVKPSTWKAALSSMFLDLQSRALIADADFCMNSLQVGVSTVNPNRFETSFDYERTGFVRVASTSVRAGFSFGV